MSPDLFPINNLYVKNTGTLCLPCAGKTQKTFLEVIGKLNKVYVLDLYLVNPHCEMEDSAAYDFLDESLLHIYCETRCWKRQ